jgi:hypothetical protein
MDDMSGMEFQDDLRERALSRERLSRQCLSADIAQFSDTLCILIAEDVASDVFLLVSSRYGEVCNA